MGSKKSLTVKRLIRSFIILSLVLLGLFLFGLLLLFLPPGEKLLRQFAEEQLSQSLGYPVEIGDLETNVLLYIQAKRVNIYPVEGSREKPLLQLKSARLEYRLWEILSQPPRIHSLTLDSLYIKIKRDSSGVFKLPPTLSKAGKAETGADSSFTLPFVRFEKLALTHIEVDYEDEFIPFHGKLFDLNIQIESHPHFPGKDDYLLRLQVDSCDAAYLNESISAQNIKVQAGLVDQTLKVDTLMAVLPGFVLGGRGTISLESNLYPIDVKLQGSGSPKKLWHTFRETFYPSLNTLEGEINVNLAISGDLDNPVVGLFIDSPNLQADETVAQNTSLKARYQNSQLFVDKLQSNLFDGTIAGHGEIAFDNLITHHIELELRALNFQKALQFGIGMQLPYGGNISGSLVSRGSLLSIEGLQTTTDLAIHDLSYKLRPLADFETTVSLQNGNAQLDCRWGDTRLLSNANIYNQKIRGKFTVEVPEIDSIAELFELNDLSGSTCASGTISGTMPSPQLDIDVLGTNIRYWNLPGDTVKGHLVFRNNQLLIEESFFAGSTAEIDTVNPPFGFSGWRGGFSYTAQLSGPLTDLKGDLSAQFSRPTLVGYSFEKGNLRLVLENNILSIKTLHLSKSPYAMGLTGDYSIQASLIHGRLHMSSETSPAIPSTGEDAANTIRFQYNFADTSRRNLDLKGRNIDLNILNSLGGFAEEAAGESNFDLEWNGILDSPRIVGKIDISDGNLQLSANAEPIRNFAMQLSFSDSVLEIENISANIGEIPVRISGDVVGAQNRIFADLDLSMFDKELLNGIGYISPDSIDYKLKIQNLDLSLFEPFIPRVTSLNGLLNSTLSIQGVPSNPSILGNLDISDLSIEHDFPFSPLNRGLVRLNFNQNQTKLDTFFLSMGDGRISASGTILHNQGEPALFDLRLQAGKLESEQPGNYAVKIDSALLSYKTRDNVHYLAGDLVLGDSRITRKVDIADYLKLAREQVIATLEGPSQEPLDLLSVMKDRQISRKDEPAFLHQTEMDIRLRDSDSLWVDNNLANIRMDAELNLIGRLNNPTLTGRLTIAEGQIQFLDRNFEVTRGVMDFADPQRANPVLDIEAETRSMTLKDVGEEEYEIFLKIFGPLDDFDYKLTSEPTLEESDIISLLTLGVTSSHLAGEGTSGDGITMNTVLQQRMGLLVSQQANNTLSDYTAQLFGKDFFIDQMGVTGNLFDKEDAGFWASKKIIDRLELRFIKSFNKINDYSFQADYPLLKYFYLRGTINQKNESEGSFKFRLRFR